MPVTTSKLKEMEKEKGKFIPFTGGICDAIMVYRECKSVSSFYVYVASFFYPGAGWFGWESICDICINSYCWL